MQATRYPRAFMGLFAFLSESIIGFTIRHGPSGFFKPACPNVRVGIKFNHIRLDVQKWGAVENVHVLDVKYAAFNAVEADD